MIEIYISAENHRCSRYGPPSANVEQDFSLAPPLNRYFHWENISTSLSADISTWKYIMNVWSYWYISTDLSKYLTSYSPPQSLAQQAGPGLKMFLYFTVTQRLDDFRHSFVKFFGHEPVSNTDRRWWQGDLTITRSSWLNCALRDNEAVYWVSIGQYKSVVVCNWWYWVSRGHLCLCKLNKVEIWTCVINALLTDWLTDRLWKIELISL